MRDFRYKRTKLKLLGTKKSKRIYICLTSKYESRTVNGYKINKNGKVCY
jgi:hypothetical protein